MPTTIKRNTVGSGPFKLKNYVRGSSIEMERNPNYWKKGLPYLDGIKYFIITDNAARAKAIRSGRVDVELRFLPPGEVDAIKAQLGDKVVVAGSRTSAILGSPSMWTRSPSTMNGCARPCPWPSTAMIWPKRWPADQSGHGRGPDAPGQPVGLEPGRAGTDAGL